MNLKRILTQASVVVLLFAAALNAVCADEVSSRPFLHPLFSEHMVLQRDRPVPVWGWTTPGQKVTVKLGSKTASGTAGPDGRWQVKIGPLHAGGPYAFTVTGPETIEFTDVLMGDVWLCSGQSNMEMGIGACKATNDIASANFPEIRLLTVPKRISTKPLATLDCKWLQCSPTSVSQGGWGGFSAAGFFFGRELYQNLKIPIGLIHSSWGGTVAEAWTSFDALRPLSDFQSRLDQVVAMQFAKLPASKPPADEKNPNISTVLYNGMIAPLLPFAIKGAIWYQGESNADRARQYRALLPAMIQDWRHRFGVGDFPFYIVQLASFQDTFPEPRDNNWAELREAQALTVRNVSHTGLAVAIDIGEAKDIHPKNKQEVGRRLALCALGRTYGKKIEWSGPWYKSMQVTDNGVRLSFDHADGGLRAKGDKLTGFAIAGDDRKFVWADAVVEGNSVLVSSPKVAKPAAVRYAWDINPVCNLYNQAGLPAVPFRTDDWPMLTRDHK